MTLLLENDAAFVAVVLSADMPVDNVLGGAAAVYCFAVVAGVLLLFLLFMFLQVMQILLMLLMSLKVALLLMLFYVLSGGAGFNAVAVVEGGAALIAVPGCSRWWSCG